MTYNSAIAQLTITWEKLPPDFLLPDEPVENIYQPLLAAALREILDLSGFITPEMLIGSNFGLCATINGKIVVKAPDWFYISSVFPLESGVIRRSYTPYLEGDTPAVVMEFLSDAEQSEYSAKSTYPYGKWYFYERILQVPIYVIFEPKEGILEVHSLKNGRYELEKADQNERYWIETMNLYLGVWYGTRNQLTTYWLRWWDNMGHLLPWANERVEQSLSQGILQGKQDLIIRLLTRKFGTIAPELQTKIKSLSAQDLDDLSECGTRSAPQSLLDFSELSSLSNWLAQR
ncbi:DUF4351 domain-containing protein [Gloeothece verrucosa]|uniref:Restriction endonuclease domain-containing protein n=1 Tax=Gloeothece verrucosa (strain PCC 7822) TaxID=497965 RepID=E0U5Q0_GLOV7|nr:DUF4351 domain-containing protein [Gloeothece verrucosa]ADN15891.1 hypothetical protein Cyan7822_3965 [Gloeothece verrucosa PCC 7822]